MTSILYTKTISTTLKQLCVRQITTSQILCHNPAGAKKKTKIVVDKKKQQKLLEKQLGRLKKMPLMTPVDPDMVPDAAWFEPDRQRPSPNLSEEVIESRILLQKEWSRHKMQSHVAGLKLIRNKMKLRETAMKELKKESEFLYQEAFNIDKDILPLTLKGPMETPPMEDYIAPDFVDKK